MCLPTKKHIYCDMFLKDQIFCGVWPEKSQVSQKLLEQVWDRVWNHNKQNRFDGELIWTLEKWEIESWGNNCRIHMFTLWFGRKNTFPRWRICRDTFLKMWVIFVFHLQLNSNIVNSALEVETTSGRRSVLLNLVNIFCVLCFCICLYFVPLCIKTTLEHPGSFNN